MRCIETVPFYIHTETKKNKAKEAEEKHMPNVTIKKYLTTQG